MRGPMGDDVSVLDVAAITFSAVGVSRSDDSMSRTSLSADAVSHASDRDADGGRMVGVDQDGNPVRAVEQLAESVNLAAQRLEEVINTCRATIAETRRLIATAAEQRAPVTAANGSGHVGLKPLGSTDHPNGDHPLPATVMLPLEIGTLRLDPQRMKVERDGQAWLLTRTEWQIFVALLTHPGQVLSRSALAEMAWGDDRVDRSQEVEVYISRVRRKMESDPRRPQLIRTVRGRGYVLRSPERLETPAPSA